MVTSSTKDTQDRILVVDDTPDNLFLIQATLEGEGYDIELVTNGQDALNSVSANPPDLILLDVMMPNMDGYEVTERIRKNPALPFIPILLITAHQQSNVVTGLDAGADDFIRKPVDVDEILARVRSLLRLKHSIDERERLSRQQQDFVSRLTHDLRTPLVAADRMMNLFVDNTFGETTPEMRDALTAMIRSNQNLLQMVNMILEVFRHDVGEKKLNFGPCNVEELLTNVVQELMPLAAEKGLVLVTDFNPSESRQENVQGDRLELQRVFTNLVGNAIKFTDEGTIHIEVSQVPAEDTSEDQRDDWVAIAIKDTGKGIQPEDQPYVFERYRQGNHKRSGSGLGLYLSRQIIQAHRGSIDMQSKLGEGSVFTVKLPVGR